VHACVPYSTQGGPGETGNTSRCDPDKPGARTRAADATTGCLANALRARSQLCGRYIRLGRSPKTLKKTCLGRGPRRGPESPPPLLSFWAQNHDLRPISNQQWQKKFPSEQAQRQRALNRSCLRTSRLARGSRRPPPPVVQPLHR
jgi:hypothetical protein